VAVDNGIEIDIAFQVLGPVQVRTATGPIMLRGKHRSLLAVLLLNGNHVVSVDRLAEALWDMPLPGNAAGRVRTLVSEIRRRCEPLGDLIVTQSPGYLLQYERGRLDLDRFMDTVQLAQEATTAGQAQTALARYDQALAMWAGAPLGGARGPFAEAHVARLEELRVQAQEGRVEAMLALGRHAELVADLGRFVAEQPLRERAHALLMTALYRDGQRGKALAVYRDLRLRLIAELGLEPTTQLQLLHQQVLAGDAALDGPAPLPPEAVTPEPFAEPEPLAEPGPPPAPAPHVVPRQLQNTTSLFVGRQAQLRRLDAVLERSRPLVVVSGPAGAGKTTLALRWAHTAAGQFPDGQIFLDMRGFDHGHVMTPLEAVPLLLQALGCRRGEVPPTLAGQVALYRTMVADRRILLVLDDVAHGRQIHDLLPGGPHCMTLITSRSRMSGLKAMAGAVRITCDVLDPDSSVDLLSRAVGAERVSAEPAAAARLAGLCDHLPLALCLAAAHIDEDTADGAIGRFVDRMTAGGRLVQLRLDGDENSAVRAALDASYRALPVTAQTVFRSIGLMPSTGRAVAALAAALAMGRTDLEEALGAAARVHLLKRAGPARVAWHDLVHEYAVERLLEQESAEDREAATIRLFEHYLHSAVAAAGRCGFAASLPPSADAGEHPETAGFATQADAVAWFDATWGEMAAAIKYAAAHGPRRYAWLLVDALRDFMLHRRPLSDLARMTEIGLSVADAEEDLVARAAMRATAGRAAWRASDLPRALAEFGSAGKLAHEAAWLSGQAQAEQGIGIVLKQTGEPERALGHYRRAAAIHQEDGDKSGVAASLSELASACIALARLPEAEEALHIALPLAEETDLHLRSVILVHLGEVHRLRGDLGDAQAMVNEALDVAASAGSAYARATALEALGRLHAGRGDRAAAKTVLAEALALAGQVEHRVCEASVLIGLSGLAIADEDLDTAGQQIDAAILIADRIGVTELQASALLGEAALRLAQDRPRAAVARARSAASLAAAGSPLLLPAILLLEARSLDRVGDTEGAARAADRARQLAGESGQLPVEQEAAVVLAGLRRASRPGAVSSR
jgi:DNA-binding SARP family transcriptional activator